MERINFMPVCHGLVLAVAVVLGCARAPSADNEKAASSARDDTATPLVTLSGEEFDQRVLASKKPVVVDFFSPVCAICEGVEPVVADVADEYRDQIEVFKVDVFQDDALAKKYEVGVPPVFLIFRDGEVVGQLGGPITREDLVEKIQTLLEG